jgi:hypothetical protein
MKSTLKLMTTAACLLALSGLAYAADKPSPQTVPGTAVEGNAMKDNSGALTAPEANKSDMSPSTANSESGDAAANIPGTKTDGNRSEDNATLSGDNSAPSVKGSGDTGKAAANIPGTKSDGDSSAANPSLGGDSKDKM